MSADSARPPTVGVIGTGRMGLGLCARLRECGFAVIGGDARGEARPALEALGAEWADGPGALTGRCDRVLTVLPGPAEVQSVRAELLSAMTSGQAWIDLSTSTPAAARSHAAHARDHGVSFLDAPMGGGPVQARSGELTLFIGGPPATVTAQHELTSALAAQVLHVGEVGSGCLVKLLANLLWFGQAVAGAEALALASRAGLDPERTRTALAQSAGASRFMAHEAQALLAGDDLESFSLAGCLEELQAVMALGDELDAPLAVGARVTALYDEALEHYGDVDGELLAARLVAERAGAGFAGPQTREDVTPDPLRAA